MAEFWRALRPLKALQAAQAARPEHAAATDPARAEPRVRPIAAPPLAPRPQPNEPKHGVRRQLDYVPSKPPARRPTLHESAALWLPNEPETGSGGGSRI